ncbi:putative ankyrin repeat protein [Chloropicon roscoffensis]|uniref:Ankyrin repeat protein n=1 Tax=Chloropicon roscoffensis TaxID=1461544 RepID=A0AAX4PI21_9CHLO
MARGAESTSSAKRAKLCTKKKRDALERERNELILGVANARAKAKELEERLVREAVREAKEALAQRLPSVCADLEAENRDELMEKLPPELWEKILDENVQQNDLLAFAMTCRFFREKQKDLGKKVETNLNPWRLVELRKSGEVASHSLGWFRWVCDTLEILPGFKDRYEMVKGAVYEGDLVNYAALQGSVEILRWLMEEKGCELNKNTDWSAGKGGSIEVFEYLLERGYEFDRKACEGAARGGCLKALKFLRSQDPPCPWNAETCGWAADGGHLEVLKWLRAQNPPCPWNWEACWRAAEEGHLEVLKWLRSQDPPCPWSRSECREEASKSIDGHQRIVDWIDQQEDESDVEYTEFSDGDDPLAMYDSDGELIL